MSEIKKFIETAEASVFIRGNELKKRNIKIGDMRTSVTLEPQIWTILHDISDEHECSIHELCELINRRKNASSSLASAIRVFLISYLHLQSKRGK